MLGKVAQSGTDFDHDVVRPNVGRPDDLLQNRVARQEILAETFLGSQTK